MRLDLTFYSIQNVLRNADRRKIDKSSTICVTDVKTDSLLMEDKKKNIMQKNVVGCNGIK